MPLDITSQALAAATAALPADQAIFMLNLLRYRDEARYENGSDLPSCSGREAYFTRYVPAFAKVTQGQGIALQWLGAVGAVLVAGDAEGWDDVALIRYPDFATFRRMIGGADYQETAELHRLAALADWRLIATTETPLR